MGNKIENAIIIHGPGRSGTTLFNEILSLHPDLFYLSGFDEKFPGYPALSFLNRMNRIQWFEEWTRKKGIKWFRSNEAYSYWDHYLLVMSTLMEEEEYDESDLHRLVRSIQRRRVWSGSNRFMTKITGAARSEFISGIFQDPVILFIDRDPRLVVDSYRKQKWRVKKGKDRFSQSSDEEILSFYSNLYLSFYNTRDSLKKFRILFLKYEDLVEDPLSFFEKVCQFSGLDLSPGFQKKIQGWPIYGSKRIEEYFDQRSLMNLNQWLKTPIQELGYS